jgi:hypothetical protein
MSDAVVRAACVANFAAHTKDCSGFVKAVGAQIGVPLAGLANDIVDTIRAGGDWVALADGAAAAAAANNGQFVVAGLRGDEQAKADVHGHVVVVVAGPLDPAHGKYPHGYWGSLGGAPGSDQTLNFAWNVADRDNVTYAAHDLPA